MSTDASPAPAAAAAAMVHARGPWTTTASSGLGVGGGTVTLTPMAVAEGIGGDPAVKLTEHQRLVGALRERAAATAAVATTMPREGAAHLQDALANEHSSLLRCLNLLDEDQGSVISSPQTASEVTKTAKKRQRRQRPQRRHSDTQAGAACQDKSFKAAQRDRKSKSPSMSSHSGRYRTQNTARDESQNNLDALAKQRNAKPIPRKRIENVQKPANIQSRNPKLINDKKKKTLKPLKINKLVTGAATRNSLPRETSPQEDKRTTKQRQVKAINRNRSKDYLDMTVATLDNASCLPNRVGGDVPKKVPKPQQGKLRKTATLKSLLVPLASSNSNRKIEVKKPQITKRGKQKRQPKLIQKAITYKSFCEPEVLPLISRNDIPRNEADGTLTDKHYNEELDLAGNQTGFGDGGSIPCIETCAGISNLILPLFRKTGGALEEETNQLSHPFVTGNKPEPDNFLCPPVPQESTEICLRSILRDTNKKLVGLGNKTVRFYEDTITTPKKGKKKKQKFTNKSIVSEKAGNRKLPRLCSVGPKLVNEPIGRHPRISTSKVFELAKKKKRGKARAKEKNDASYEPEVALRNMDSLNKIIEDTVDEVTPYLQNQTFYAQDRSNIGKSVADTIFPINETAQDKKPANTTATKAIKISRREQNEEVTHSAPFKTTDQYATSTTVAASPTINYDGTPSSRSSKKITSARKSEKIDSKSYLNEKMLRCQRNSWNDIMDRYSTMLDEIPKTSGEKKIVTEPKLSAALMRPTNSSASTEEILKRRTPVSVTRRRSTLMKKDTNVTNRNVVYRKPSSRGLQPYSSRKTEEERHSSIGNMHRRSISQTSWTNAKPSSELYTVAPNLARPNVERVSSELTNYQKSEKSNTFNYTARPINVARTFIHNREPSKTIHRSASTSYAPAKAMTTSHETRVLQDSHKMNVPSARTERYQNGAYNWHRGTFKVLPRNNSGTDGNIPKWVNDESIINIGNTPPCHFIGRSTRRKGDTYQREKSDSISRTSEISDINDFSDRTITSGGDFSSSRASGMRSNSRSHKMRRIVPIYGLQRRNNSAIEDISLASSTTSQRSTSFSNIEQYPIKNAYPNMENTTDIPQSRPCPNCTPDKLCWQHTPTLKYLFQAFADELSGAPSNKNYKKYPNTMTKNKGVYEAKSSIGTLPRNTRLVEKDSGITLVRQSSGGLNKVRKQRPSSSAKSSFQKFVVYSSELDDDTHSSRKSRRSGKRSPKKKEKRTSAKSERSIDNAKPSRSQSCRPSSPRCPKAHPSFNSLVDSRTLLSRSKIMKPDNSLTKTRTLSNTSFSSRKSNAREVPATDSNHPRLPTSSTSRISNTSKKSTRQSSRSKTEDRPQLIRASTGNSQQTTRRSIRKR